MCSINICEWVMARQSNICYLWRNETINIENEKWFWCNENVFQSIIILLNHKPKSPATAKFHFQRFPLDFCEIIYILSSAHTMNAIPFIKKITEIEKNTKCLALWVWWTSQLIYNFSLFNLLMLYSTWTGVLKYFFSLSPHVAFFGRCVSFSDCF